MSIKAGTGILILFRITIDALRRTVPIDYRALTIEHKKIGETLELLILLRSLPLKKLTSVSKW